MNEKTIDERIHEKRGTLIGIHGALAVHMLKKLRIDQKARVSELQDRLEFRIKEAEEQLLDDKIGIYQECLNVLKS